MMHGPVLVVTGQAKLTDGAVVTFRRALPQPSLEWPIRALALLGVLGLFVAFVAGWALRKVTRPLASLADAASGLARDLSNDAGIQAIDAENEIRELLGIKTDQAA